MELLVAPVLPLVALARSGRLLDVGSGNGSPGLVLALLRPELEVTLLEPRAKRWAFLREAARTAGRDVEVLRQRHDAYEGPPARTLTIRALRLPMLELARLVEPDGRLVVLGRAPEPSGPFVSEPPPEGTTALHVWRRERST